MSRRQDTRSPKVDASLGRKVQYLLSEWQFASLKTREVLKNELEREGAKNLKVYPGAWWIARRIDNTILRKEAAHVLHSCAAPSDLLAWLEARNARGAIVIEAEAPPRAPREYNELDELYGEFVGPPEDRVFAMEFGNAWGSVKLLEKADDPLEQEKRIEHLWRTHPEAAEKLGLLKPPVLDRKAMRSERQNITRAMVATIKRDNPGASIERICQLLDAKPVPLPKIWKALGFMTWHAIWTSLAHRRRVKRMISGIKPAAAEKE